METLACSLCRVCTYHLTPTSLNPFPLTLRVAQNRSPNRTHAAPVPVLASVAYSSRTAPAFTPAPTDAPEPGRR